MKYKRKMKYILRVVDRTGKVPKIEPDLVEPLADCVKRDYLTGVIIARCASGKASFDFQDHIRVTYDGYRFLSPWNNLRANVSLALSILAIVISILSCLDRIIASVKSIVDFVLSLK